jgi:hypothetical protein
MHIPHQGDLVFPSHLSIFVFVSFFWLQGCCRAAYGVLTQWFSTYSVIVHYNWTLVCVLSLVHFVIFTLYILTYIGS